MWNHSRLSVGRPPAWLAALLPAVLLGMPPAAHALEIVQRDIGTFHHVMGEYDWGTRSVSADGSRWTSEGHLSALNDVGFGISSAKVHSFLTTGRISVGAQAANFLNSTDATGIANGSSGTSVTLRDRFTVDCPTCRDGTVGQLSFRMLLGASTDMRSELLDNTGRWGQERVSASWGATVGLRSLVDPGSGGGEPFARTFYIDGSESIYNGVRSTHGELGYREVEMRLSFVFGQPLEFVFHARASAGAEAAGADGLTNGWGSASIRVDNNRWLGLGEVLDSEGRPVLDYTAFSADGFNYAQAAVVPEPGSALLMIAGGLALVVVGARRRRGADPGA